MIKKQIDEARASEEMNAMRAEHGLEPLLDHLWAAKVARDAAKLAVKEGRYDDAWGLFHSEKDEFIQHANKSGFTAHQVIALDSSVSESMANFLRLEKKHQHVFVHILYWVAGGSERPTKAQETKLRTYFNRCKFEGLELAAVKHFLTTLEPLPDFVAVQSKVEEWRQRSRPTQSD